MAEKKPTHPAARRQSSRLQRQAPASIQINPVSGWNVAIPLLSPLVTSPESRDWTAVEVKSACSYGVAPQAKAQETPPVVFKKWQHPAAPFSYEPAPPPRLLPYVCTAAADNRSS